jgi:hypothetical protein
LPIRRPRRLEALMEPELPLRLRGDEAELFAGFEKQLRRWVGAQVSTSRVNIEDACSFAWLQFLRHQPDRDREWRAWLVTVARREAIRLKELDGRTPGRVAPGETGLGNVDPVDHKAVVERSVDLNEAFARLAELRPRLRRIAFLRAMGHSYAAIEEITGDSQTRVGQLVSRANELLWDAAQTRERAERPQPQRAARLHELERNPPQWLTQVIGRPPGRANHRASDLLLWRRAALALDDYRAQLGRGREAELAVVPDDPRQARLHSSAWRAAERYRDASAREREARGRTR